MAVIEARELYRFFHVADEEMVALRGVDLSLEAGEFVTLVGPSGSGKSTLLACVAGIDVPDGGRVDILGQRVTRRSESVRARIRARSIGMVLQHGNLIDHLSVDGNIRLQRKLAGKGATSAPELLGRLGLSLRWNALPGQLSGGEAARAGLAVALAAEPTILICDEPTAEVDAATEERIVVEFLAARDAGKAILVATHSQSLAAAADRVITIRDGGIVDAG